MVEEVAEGEFEGGCGVVGGLLCLWGLVGGVMGFGESGGKRLTPYFWMETFVRCINVFERSSVSDVYFTEQKRANPWVYLYAVRGFQDVTRTLMMGNRVGEKALVKCSGVCGTTPGDGKEKNPFTSLIEYSLQSQIEFLPPNQKRIIDVSRHNVGVFAIRVGPPI